MSTDKRQNPLKIKDFSVCPYYIVLADPAGKMGGNHAPAQGGQDTKRNIRRQVFRFVYVARAAQAEIEHLLHVVPTVSVDQPIGLV